MLNFLLTILASIGIILGVLSMLTPIPGGIFIIAGSTSLLICSSPTAQSILKTCRTHINWLNKAFFWIENKVGVKVKFIGTALLQTRPDIKCTKTEESENDLLERTRLISCVRHRPRFS